MITEGISKALADLRAAGCDADVALTKAEAVEPVAWIRYRPDGLWDGPIHSSEFTEYHRKSGQWTPLYAHAPPAVPVASLGRDADTRLPDGYAYVYPANGGGETIRVGSNGREINGSTPIRAIPYYFDHPKQPVEPPASVPDGFALVPIIPTVAMTDAYWTAVLLPDNSRLADRPKAAARWKAMLDAGAKPTKSACIWPDCGHDTNCTGYSPGCTGEFCPKPQANAKTPCPACKGVGGSLWMEADGSENGEKCEACDGFGSAQHPAARRLALDTFAERLADAISLIDLSATNIPVLAQADKELRALYRDMKANPAPPTSQEGAAP